MNTESFGVPWRSFEDFLPRRAIDALRFLRVRAAFARRASKVGAAENRQWLNRFAGEEVFVIANGPSVARFDRRRFAGKAVIVMNNFDRAEWKSEVRIVAHCLGEPRNSSAWHDPLPCLQGTASLSYWMHFSAFGFFDPSDKNVRFVFPGFEPRLWSGQRISLENVTLGYQTTAQLAIMVALFMGFARISLVGFDHDWLASPDYSRHFYSSQKDSMDVLGTFPYYDVMRFSMRMWEIYYALRRSAGAHGAQIVNLTDGTFLDVFQAGR